MPEPMPAIEVGDWVRARSGFPAVLIVAAVGVLDDEPAAFDDGGGALRAGVIVEIRKPDGTVWYRGG